MSLYQFFWKPNNHTLRIHIRHCGNYTEVHMPYYYNPLSPIVVIDGHSVDVVIDDIRTNPTPKGVEAVRVYENL